MPRLAVAVLASGSGSTFQNLVERAARGEIPIDVVAVVSSKAGAAVLERARRAGIAAYECDRKAYPDDAAFSAAVTAALDRHSPDLVCMAGFLHLYHIPPRYAGRVVNVHPSLLPKYGGKGFYDLRVHRAVLAAGDAETGCTVHFCDERYDTGPIILQERIAVEPGDTPESLRAKVQSLERRAYPEAIRRIAEGLVPLGSR